MSRKESRCHDISEENVDGVSWLRHGLVDYIFIPATFGDRAVSVDPIQRPSHLRIQAVDLPGR